METSVSRKKRMILTARELAAQRAAGPASSRGFLRSLVASVTRPAQRSAADTLAALRAEVSSSSGCMATAMTVQRRRIFSGCFGSGQRPAALAVPGPPSGYSIVICS
jgi:hypothetical protein